MLLFYSEEGFDSTGLYLAYYWGRHWLSFVPFGPRVIQVVYLKFSQSLSPSKLGLLGQGHVSVTPKPATLRVYLKVFLSVDVSVCLNVNNICIYIYMKIYVYIHTCLRERIPQQKIVGQSSAYILLAKMLRVWTAAGSSHFCCVKNTTVCCQDTV